MKKRNMKKGFTLVELVIVIAVIAILAGVLIPTFGGIITKAQKSAVQQEAANIYREVYALDLSDGKVDGKDGAVKIEYTNYTTTLTANTSLGGTKGSDASLVTFTYTFAAGAVTKFEFSKNGYTATFTVASNTWSVTEPSA